MAESREIKSFGAKREEGDELVVKDENVLEYNDIFEGTFPPDFKFGCGSSAVQIEGGWNADGKGPSVWDELCLKTPEKIDDRSSCDVVCDSYNQYLEDVRILKEMGANAYKFSLSWSRILPDGTTNHVNEAGVKYYDNLINALIAENIEPIVVIWHFDLPQKLQEKTSWRENETELISRFVDYASLCFSRFGDRVKRWMTINEPWVYTMAAHNLGMFPPYQVDAEGVYKVIHNLLIAHAKTYRIYEQKYKHQNGKVGISLDCWGFQPASDSEEDKNATQQAFEFKFGVCAHPLFYGKYPDSMRKIIDAKSKTEGREESRLPEITPELSKLMKGTCDFIGLNHYTCEIVASHLSQLPEGVTPLSYSSSKELGFSVDEGGFHFYDPKWPGSQTWWLKFTPHALRPLLRRIRDDYGNPEVMITENGYPDKLDKMEDIGRGVYFTAYFNETLKAILLDGCNVKGFMAWGLIDGWEWTSGHSLTFGVHHVDFNDPKKKRTPRHSAKVLREIFNNKGFIKKA